MDRRQIIASLGVPTLSKDILSVDRIIAESLGGGMERFLTERVAGGKRLRPMMLILASGGKSKVPVLKAAAAVEMLHQASKLHDDVLDKDAEQPAKYLLGGDLLISAGLALAAGQGRQTMQLLSDTIAAMIEGEWRQAQLKPGIGPDDKLYLKVCGLKTAALFRSAAHIGARLGGLDSASISSLEDFGHNYGLAYQIHDDVWDGYFDDKLLPSAKAAAGRYREAALEVLPAGRHPLNRFIESTLPVLS